MTNNIQEVLNLEGTKAKGTKKKIVARKERQLIHLLTEAEKRVQYDADYYATKGKHRSSYLNITQYRIWGIAKNTLTGEKQEFPIIPVFTDIKSRLSKKRSTPCLISLWNVFGDASYNRSEEINWAQIDENLTYSEGFDISAAAYIEVLYDADNDRFIVTKGQHRIIMLWLALGDDALIAANVKLLDDDYTEEEHITSESKDHFVDAQKVARQKAHQKGLSAYVSGDEEDIKYTNFILSHGIGVKGKMHLFPQCSEFKRQCDTPWAVQASEVISKENTSKALHLLNTYLPSKDKVIGGKSIKCVTTYLTMFEDKITNTVKKNEPKWESNDEFVDDVFKYIFNKRNVASNKWLKGSQVLRGENITLPLARLVNYTNQFCAESRVKLPDGRKFDDGDWCSTSEDVWTNFLQDTPRELHVSINSLIE
tara:strand:- start:63 stop:1334 length:1272 start_codon:yes stop_codon:yes gene_type:complete